MPLLIQMLICLSPLIPLGFLAYGVIQFDKALNKKRIIREAQVQFKGIGDWLPKELAKALKKVGVAKNDINDFLMAYKKMLNITCGYFIFWLIYIIGIVFRIFYAFHYQINELLPQQFGGVIGSIIMSILITYWFLLTPIFEIFHYYKLAEWGYSIWVFLMKAIDIISVKIKSIFRYICEFILSFIALYVYVRLYTMIFIGIGVKITFWLSLGLLMIYQYILLQLFSWLIKKLILFAYKKNPIFQFLIKYTKEEFLYVLLKNCTYLSMVIIYASAVDSDKTGTPMAGAIGILFLLDVFFVAERDLQRRIGSSEGKTNDQSNNKHSM